MIFIAFAMKSKCIISILMMKMTPKTSYVFIYFVDEFCRHICEKAQIIREIYKLYYMILQKLYIFHLHTICK